MKARGSRTAETSAVQRALHTLYAEEPKALQDAFDLDLSGPFWRDRYRELGNEGRKSRESCSHNQPNKTPGGVVEKILHLRRTYQMGPIRIVWYLERYHDIKSSDATVYRVCKHHCMNKLPNRVGRRECFLISTRECRDDCMVLLGTDSMIRNTSPRM